MKNIGRQRRHTRIRRSVKGTDERLRLVIFRSNKHMYAQIIDDLKSQTVVSLCTLDKEFKDKKIKCSDKNAAFTIGQLLAQKAQQKGIRAVCFDRAGYQFHGRVKALADGARKGGLVF